MYPRYISGQPAVMHILDEIPERNSREIKINPGFPLINLILTESWYLLWKYVSIETFLSIKAAFKTYQSKTNKG